MKDYDLEWNADYNQRVEELGEALGPIFPPLPPSTLEGVIRGMISQETLDILVRLEEMARVSFEDTSVYQLPISDRAKRSLQLAGIKTLNQLQGRTAADLLRIDNFGQNSLNEVQAVLEKIKS